MSSVPPALKSIVLLAHGPTTDTLNAARRLEPLVENPKSIVVVAATPPGLTAVDRAADRGYTTSTLPASQLALLLDPDDGSSPGPTMVLHDDVLIDSSSVAALCEAHALAGLVAITPHQMAADDLVDVVCAVGSPHQLSALAAAAAFAPGMTVPGGDFVQAPHATSTHGATCQQRTIHPRDLGRPLLVAALIVRDEENTIRPCLDSLVDVVDRIEVCDTGSLDSTREIAVEAGASVTEVEWRDDFAWARNQVRDRCTDAVYMLWIDADERFDCDDPVAFRSMLATYHDVYPSYSLDLHNIRADGTETHSFVTRRIANPSLVRFEGALHERAERVDGQPLVTAYVTNGSIRHVGYDENVVDLEKKRERNLSTARQGFEDDPSETNAVQLARAIRAASTDPNSTLRELSQIRDSLSDPSDTIQAVMSGLAAELLLDASRLDEAVDAAKATLELVPADAVAGAVLAEALRQCNRFGDIVETAREYAARQSVAPLVKDHVASQTRARIIFEAAIRLGDIESAVEQAGDLPAELDPWPILSRHLSTAELLGLSDGAATTDDVRFVRVASTRGDLSHSDLQALTRSFAQTRDAAIIGLLDSANETLDATDSHADLRAVFVREQSSQAATAYARSLSIAHVDLAMELDDVERLHDPVAAALSIAATAHERRGDPQSAITDATASLDRWPGCTRAAVLAAKHLIETGSPRNAIEIIDACFESEHHDRITTDRRHDLARLSGRAHLARGDVEEALHEASTVVESGRDLDLWPEFLAATDGDLDASTLMLSLALVSDGVEFIDAVVSSVAPARSAQLCAAYLSLGGQNPDAVSTGVLAASLAGLDELGLVVAEYGGLLTDDIRSRLVAHLDHDYPTKIGTRLREFESAQAS